MKRITMLMLVCLATVCSYGQQALELKLKKGADKPNTATEQSYLLEIVSGSNVIPEFSISTENVNCEGISADKNVALQKKVMNNTKSTVLKKSQLASNNAMEFYVEISRPPNTPLNTWNCIEVKAVSNDGNVLSNTILIKSLIPDPKNFN